jgi:hypothetical protein
MNGAIKADGYSASSKISAAKAVLIKLMAVSSANNEIRKTPLISF